jgi:O-acetyl-ADP-ribose deacetylase (regulator of RNase III)
MILPQDVKDTQNAYYYTKALLELVDKMGWEYKKVLAPVPCTGVGRMTSEKCATQMKAALDDHRNGMKLDSEDTAKDLVRFRHVMTMQPKTYENSLYDGSVQHQKLRSYEGLSANNSNSNAVWW